MIGKRLKRKSDITDAITAIMDANRAQKDKPITNNGKYHKQ